MRRPLSKNARFRLFVLALSLSYSFAFLFVVWMQARHSSRRLASIERTMLERVESIRSEMVASSDSSSDPSSASSSSVSSGRLVDEDIPRYVVLGHGRSKRWGYIDIQYVCDGEVDRFFYRPETLRFVVDDIERESFRHEYGLVSRSRPVRVFDDVASDPL